MEVPCKRSSTVPSLPPPSPTSPPGYRDLYGKRRQLAKVQVLEREIGLLEEELRSLEGLEPASRCCKELEGFIGAKPDPLIATNQKICRSHYFWKRLWEKFCFKFPWICCFNGGSLHPEMPNCCACGTSDNSYCPGCNCLKNMSCQKCCNLSVPSCPQCTCSGFKLFYTKCIKVKLCSSCAKTCYNPCFLYY